MTMSLTSRTRPLLALALLLLTAACSGPGSEEPVPPPTDKDPLTTLHGQLLLASEHPVDGPVRLALAWYPGTPPDGEALPLSQPRRLVNDGIAHPAQSPASVRFDVPSPPPAAALQPLPQGFVGRGALGLLLAYADGNANARLDTIPGTGPRVDRVLGSSWNWTASPAFLLLYVDSDQPAGTGLHQGFNLVKLTANGAQEVVPASTPIPLVLSGGPFLDLLVCEVAWTGAQGEKPCGLELDPETEDPAGQLSVSGSVTVSPDNAEVDLSVALDGATVEDAAVTLGGVDLLLDLASGHYRSGSLDPALFTRAQGAELRVSLRGQELRQRLTVPSGFALEALSPIQSGTPFTVRWSASDGAQAFNLSVDADGVGNLDSASGLTGTSYTVGPLAHSGIARLRVEAVNWLGDEHSGRLELKVVRTQSLSFEPREELPPPGDLQVTGSVVRGKYGVETDLVVTRGGVPIMDARLLLNDSELSIDPDTGHYLLVEGVFGSIFDNGPVQLRVLSHGEELQRTLTTPAPFKVLAPTLPANPRSGADLRVAWEASAGAQGYGVMVVAAVAPGILATGSTSQLELTFPSVVHEGLATLYVWAGTAAPDSDTQGHIELIFEQTVPLRFEP
jgi:hypothetical protein